MIKYQLKIIYNFLGGSLTMFVQDQPMNLLSEK